MVLTILGLLIVVLGLVGIFHRTQKQDVSFSSKEYFYNQEVRTDQNSFRKIVSYVKNQFALVVNTEKNDKIKVPVSFKRQKHPLTCEAAALAMALNYRKISVTEDKLLQELNFDTKDPKTLDNIWGDPDNGFVGNVNGSVFSGTGYGVYDKPIKDVAEIYRDAYVIQKGSLSFILGEVDKGNPVIVWGLLPRTQTINWTTLDGKDIKVQSGEHARIVMGYVGDVTNPSKIILMDPIYGKIRMSTEKFLADWQKMENRAVVIF